MIPYSFCRGAASRLDDGEFRVYVAMWCLAGCSPVRGSLMLTDGVPLTTDDIAREAPAARETVENAILALVDLGELVRDLAGALRFTRWSEVNPNPRPSETREAWRERKGRERARKLAEKQRAETEGRAPQLTMTERSSRPLHAVQDVFPTAPAGGRQRDRDRFIAHATDWLIDNGLGHIPVAVAEHAATHTDRPATPGMLRAHPYVTAYAPGREATG